MHRYTDISDIQVFVLGESMSLMQALGGALILGFTLINELWSE